jgi:hypothetical protein
MCTNTDNKTFMYLTSLNLDLVPYFVLFAPNRIQLPNEPKNTQIKSEHITLG